MPAPATASADHDVATVQIAKRRRCRRRPRSPGMLGVAAGQVASAADNVPVADADAGSRSQAAAAAG